MVLFMNATNYLPTDASDHEIKQAIIAALRKHGVASYRLIADHIQEHNNFTGGRLEELFEYMCEYGPIKEANYNTYTL